MIAAHKPGSMGFRVSRPAEARQPGDRMRAIGRDILHRLAIVAFLLALCVASFGASLVMHGAAIRAGLL